MNDTTYKYIHLDGIREDTCGDTSILRMVIELFIEGIDEFITVLDNELPEKNWPVLFQATHKIKPNISMFGVFSLESQILEMETCFRNEQDLDKLGALASLCASILAHVTTELQTELNLMPDE